MSESKTPKVLVALMPASPKVRNTKYEGIMRYARKHGPWNIELLDDHQLASELETFRNWRPDGIITRVGCKELEPFLPKAASIPAVYLDTPPPISRSQVYVHHDLAATSKMVAEYFLGQGLQNFAYIGTLPDSYWSRLRGESFSFFLQEMGQTCFTYTPLATKDWEKERAHLSVWLKNLPKPCGLFVAFDIRAKQVLDLCRETGIGVPEELSVMGADNDERICENTSPTLSSIWSDFEQGGYMAAQLLDRLMRGEVSRPFEVSYGPKMIVPRQSTRRIHTGNKLIGEALEYIRCNATEGIRVGDVVRAMGVSRRLAELRFREACGKSILQNIQEVKLGKVCEYLRSSSLPIGQIALRCGYRNETHLAVLFRRQFGKTMREFRQDSGN